MTLARRRRTARALLALLSAVACGQQAPPGPQRLLPGDAIATIGNETRLALVLKAPEAKRLRVETVLPPRASLRFGYGIPNASLVAGAGAARFEVILESGDGERRELLGRRVDPARQADRHWFDVRADLAALAGRRVTIEFGIEPEPGGEPPLGAFSDPEIASAEAAPQATNVLLLSIDTLRAKSLGSYGYARDTSPYLDELARSGALFENAITTSVTTGPSHMSLFTGLYPVNHGLRTGLEPKAPRALTIASALREVGYHTAAFTEDGYIVRANGFGEGFAEYTENRGSKRTGPGEVRITFAQAQRWIEQSAREPFYLFVHTYQVHSPYRPPEGYRGLFQDDGMPGPEDAGVRRQRDNYDREIRFVDDKLKELVASLEAAGVRGRTLLVVLADHGEEFHEHGLYQHGGAVFEESIRIPLVFVGPGIPPGRHQAQVSLIDVMPTLLDYAGVAPPAGLDGTSLLPTMRRGEALAPRTLFAEAVAKKRWLRPYKGQSWRPPLVAARRDDEKFIVHRPEEGEADPALRYDLREDTLEERPEVLAGDALRAADALVDGYLESRIPEAERPAVRAPEEIDPTLRERLRQLGYVEP